MRGVGRTLLELYLSELHEATTGHPTASHAKRVLATVCTKQHARHTLVCRVATPTRNTVAHTQQPHTQQRACPSSRVGSLSSRNYVSIYDHFCINQRIVRLNANGANGTRAL